MTQRYIGGLIYNPPGGYSGYFDGSSYLIGPTTNTAFDFGSGNWTIETWAFPTAFSNQMAVFISLDNATSNSYAIGLLINTNGSVQVYQYSGSAYFINSTSTTGVVALNTWSHIAAVRSGSNFAIFVNGTRVASVTTVSGTQAANKTVNIGQDPYANNLRYSGYLSNMRVVKGTAVYDPTQTSITVPNGPLQNITNTSLLTCRYPTFVDGSSNAFTLTVSGGATVSTQNPFPLTTLPNPAQGGAGNGIFSMSQYQSLKQQNLWPAIDPYFDYTTLLLHGNGTNGGQNNTFQDSSTNNFTITRNGNTTQGTFSPFSQTGWSNYFDGSGDYLTLPSNSAFSFGTGNFTAECWVYFTSLPAANQALFDFRDANDNTSFEMGVYSNYIPFFANSSGGVLNGSFTFSVGTWYHIAFTRSGTSLNIWVNGTNAGSTTNSTNLTGTNCKIGANVSGGDNVNGYISNARVVKGTAVYTAAFTPSTTPLTAISGTSLLTCQSNRFVDNGTANSGSGFTITVNGNTSVQAFSPFAPTAAYSASTVGGSGYFDGSGDYLQYPVITLGSSDVTAECWVYLNSLGNQEIFGINYNSDQSSYGAIRVQIASNTLRFMGTTSGSSFAFGPTSASKTPAIGEWAHIAVVRSGTTFTLYLNGTSVATATGISGSLYAGTFGGRVGSIYWSGGNDYLNGYVSNFRIVAGTAVYTGNFTPPTAPLTAITNTSLLLNFTNAAIIDNTAKNVLETVGNAQISTTQSKFGGGSMAFDGAGDYLVTNCPSGLQALGTGDFTIEMWAYWNSLPGSNNMLIDYRPATTDGAYPCLYLNGTTLYYYVSSANRITASSAVATGAWYHVALCRASSNTKLFVNGTQVGSTYADTNNYLVGTGRPYIAINGYDTTGSMNGYIDDLRITKGIARYTSNFTPQTSQWQDQ